MSHVLEYSEWAFMRLGRFTASMIFRLFAGGHRDMTDEELAVEKDNKGKRKTVDTLFGKGAYTYILEKVDELLCMQIKEDSNFEATIWGKEKEFEAYQYFEKTTGIVGTYYGIGNPMFFEYGEHAGGSPDYCTDDMVADFKCPFNGAIHLQYILIKDAAQFKSEKFDYYCQLQMNMHILKKKKALFVSYNPRVIEEKYRMKIIEIDPDPEWVAEFEMRLPAAIEELNNIISQLN